MTKTLRKAIMTRSRLDNKYQKNKSVDYTTIMRLKNKETSVMAFLKGKGKSFILILILKISQITKGFGKQ